MINNNQANKETVCQNPKEKQTRATDSQVIQIMAFPTQTLKQPPLIFLKKSKDRMENIYRELEMIIMNQKKFTELKHCLGHKKKKNIYKVSGLGTALNILSADVTQWHQCNLRLPWFIV